MFRSVQIAAAALLAVSGAAQADILWNQLPAYDDFTVAGFPNRVTASDAIFAMSDVTVPAGGWTIQTVSTYFSDLSFNPTVTSAVLNIFPKTGALPTAANDPRPTLGQGTLLVPIDVRDAGGATQQPVMIITAAGLNINLAAGDYWIGLTPTLNDGPFGSDSHWPATSVVGSQSAARGYDSFGGFPWSGLSSLNGGQSTDLAITVTGVPSPSGAAILGALGLVGVRRRRR